MFDMDKIIEIMRVNKLHDVDCNKGRVQRAQANSSMYLTLQECNCYVECYE